MKRPVLISALAALALAVLVAEAERLGNLSSNSEVYTPDDDIAVPSVTTRDGYPVFEIVVPNGWTEIQIRATTRNFEPGFLVRRNGSFVLNYVPTGATVNGRKQYQALGTNDVAQWGGTKWTFGYDNLQSTNNQVDPWDCVTFTSTSGNAYALQKEYFVYRTCTTGAAADLTWDSATSLTSQLQPGSTPGRSVLFQPSRTVLGASEWMQENHPSLVWSYSFEGVGGNDTHPDGQRVWNDMRPVEWRKARVQLTPAP